MTIADRIHGTYVHTRRVRVLATHLAAMIPPSVSVLDVGCGDGQLARAIVTQRPDIHITGIDVLAREHTGIPVQLFDGRRIPFADRSIDVVLFVDVLHHADDPAQLLQEGVRVAKHAVVIKDHCRNGLLAGPTLRFMDRVGNARFGVALPHTYWSRQQWQSAWRALGLHIGAWKSDLGLYPWPASWVFERALHFVARLEVPIPQLQPEESL